MSPDAIRCPGARQDSRARPSPASISTLRHHPKGRIKAGACLPLHVVLHHAGAGGRLGVGTGHHFVFRLRMGFEPQLTGREGRVDTGFAPPFGLIAMTVEFAVMSTAERHGELVADLAAKRPALREAQVMGI